MRFRPTREHRLVRRSRSGGVDRPRSSPPPNYLSRQVQRRLLSLTVALLLVLVAMEHAAQPKNWAWMWQLGNGRPALSQTPAQPARPPDQVVEAIPVADVAQWHFTADELRWIQDDTLFRPAEQPVWWAMFARLLQTPPERLRAAALRDVTALQLLGQMDYYRGKLVDVSGQLRRVNRVAAPANDLGIDSYYQAWVFQENQPIVVYSLEVPSALIDVAGDGQSVRLIGYAFKRWPYRAAEGLISAPVVLTRRLQWEPSADMARAAPPSRPGGRRFLLAAGVTSVAAVLLAWVLWRVAGQRPPGRSGRGFLTFLSITLTLLALDRSPLAHAQEADETQTSESVDRQEPDAGSSKTQQEAAERLKKMLALFDLGPSQWYFFSDGQPLDEGEMEPVYRLLHLLPRVGQEELELAAERLTTWAALQADPQAARGRAIVVRGRTRAVRRRSVLPEIRQRFGIAWVYELTVASIVDNRPVTVLVRDVPKSWQRLTAQQDDPAALLDQPIGCAAIFLKFGEKKTTSVPIYVAAQRIAWYADRPVPELGIGPDQCLLGRVGMDLSSLDDVRPSGPLQPGDSGAFFQMLWAVARVRTQSGVSAAPPIDVPELLQEPVQWKGNRFHVRGTARRAVRIVVTDPAVRRQFGLDHYYEVDVFVPLRQTLVLKTAIEKTERAYNSYLVTVCVRNLPQGFPQGLVIRQEAEVTAFYLKNWSYRRLRTDDERTSSDTQPAGPARYAVQLSPLLVGDALRVPALAASNDDPIEMAFVVMFFSIVATIALVALWYHRSDRRYRRRRSGPANDG